MSPSYQSVSSAQVIRLPESEAERRSQGKKTNIVRI